MPWGIDQLITATTSPLVTTRMCLAEIRTDTAVPAILADAPSDNDWLYFQALPVKLTLLALRNGAATVLSLCKLVALAPRQNTQRCGYGQQSLFPASPADVQPQISAAVS